MVRTAIERKAREMLDQVLVCDVFEAALERDGQTSVGKVAQELADKGYISSRTGHCYSRQNVWLVLKKSERGKKLIERNIHLMVHLKGP